MRLARETETQRTLRSLGRAYGTGKRKEAVARVWLFPGTGAVQVNDRPLDSYFPSFDWRAQALGTAAASPAARSWQGAVPVSIRLPGNRR